MFPLGIEDLRTHLVSAIPAGGRISLNRLILLDKLSVAVSPLNYLVLRIATMDSAPLDDIVVKEVSLQCCTEFLPPCERTLVPHNRAQS